RVRGSAFTPAGLIAKSSFLFPVLCGAFGAVFLSCSQRNQGKTIAILTCINRNQDIHWKVMAGCHDEDQIRSKISSIFRNY
ncbi:MAG: hypothetical protein RR855_21700, partial [Comamonas sp.]